MAFNAETTADEVIAGYNLTGRRVLITGAGGGIGAETARVLAGAGAEIILAVRNLEAGKETAARIARETGRPAPRVEHLDLSSLDSVRDVARRIGDAPLYGLIANAGLMSTPEGRTADGFETQMGTNHYSHFLLTTLLTPALLAGAPARVVVLSSAAHIWSDVDLDDMEFTRNYDPWLGYARSKTAAVLFAVEFTRRYGASGVTANAVMPGLIYGTGLARHLPEIGTPLPPPIPEDAPPTLPKSLSQGAATSVWAMVSPELEGRGGLYLEDCQVARPWSDADPMRGVKAYALDPDAARRLWAVSEAAVQSG